MMHSFDIDIAKEYGLNEAILLNNLWFWIEHNRANNINYYDNNYWTYNSTKAFNELFPYLSQRKIQNALKKLRDKEIIIVGNYNKSAYDRTLWYAFSEKGKCIMQKCKMDSTKSEMDITEDDSGYLNNVKPIPYNKTHLKNTDTNTSINQSVYSLEFIKKQINYSIFKNCDDEERIKEMMLIMYEILNSTNDFIIISGEKININIAKSMFLKITTDHIIYVLNCLDSCSSEIKNMKAYLTACLYNSVFTINNYYDSKIKNDLK